MRPTAPVGHAGLGAHRRREGHLVAGTDRDLLPWSRPPEDTSTRSTPRAAASRASTTVDSTSQPPGDPVGGRHAQQHRLVVRPRPRARRRRPRASAACGRRGRRRTRRRARSTAARGTGAAGSRGRRGSRRCRPRAASARRAAAAKPSTTCGDVVVRHLARPAYRPEGLRRRRRPSASRPRRRATEPCPRQGAYVEALRPACASWMPIGTPWRCANVDRGRQRLGVRVGPQPEVVGADAALGHHRGRLGEDQADSSGGEGAEVHQVPLVGEPVDGGVLAHGADPDAVVEGQAAQGERGEEHTATSPGRAPGIPGRSC